MDIKKIMNASPSVLPLNRRENGKGADVDFQELLRQASSSPKSASPTPSSLLSSAGAEPISSMAFVLPPLDEVRQVRVQGMEAVEGTLSLLEQYQNALADPAVSLKKVDPLLQFLSKEVNGLNLLAEKLSPSDPLQKILTEVGIVSTVEIEKFRRGDYI